METAGFVLGLASLAPLAQTVRSHIHALRHNNELKEGLEQQANDLIEALLSIPSTSREAGPFETVIWTKLNDLERSLRSVRTSQAESSRVARLFFATSHYNELRNCQRTLEMVTQLAKALIDGERAAHDTPTICNDLAESPTSDVGIDRTLPVREFLEKSSSQDFRVICIHGLPGLGKTTILNELWNKDSEKNPFHARAFVDIGSTDTAIHQSICNLQASILRQLGWAYKEFPNSAFGRIELAKCFKQLKGDKKPLFLAIDNVLSPGALEFLLPAALTISKGDRKPFFLAIDCTDTTESNKSVPPCRPANSNETILPAKSCIALTCRDYGIIKSLLGICDLQEDNKLQVLCYNPPLLSDQAATRLFVECAGMQQQAPEHQELLKTLVPLCKGLPFALTILGNFFMKNKDMRTHGNWQCIQKEMAFMDGEGPMSAIRTPLQLSYDRLRDLDQAAFLDMVELFYGWPWEVVECTVGKLCMTNLRDSSLISQVDSFEQCNQGAVSENTKSSIGYFYSHSRQYFGRQGHVWMHDITFNFGKSIVDNVINCQQLLT